MRATYRILQDEITLDKWSDSVPLFFFGDVHRDTKNCDVDRWNDFRSTAKERIKENKYTRFIGMGDYHDFASTREKKYLDKDVHESTRHAFDELAERHNRELAAELSFMKGRLLGLIEGNHSWVFSNAKTSGEDLAERLDSKDMGWLCHYTITFHFKNRPDTAVCIHFVLCHGKAGGKTMGITVNQVDDLRKIFPVANVYMMGHDHQKAAHPASVLRPVRGKGKYQIKQLEQLLCRSGAFVKAYQDNSDSYEIFRLYRPSSLGALELNISFYNSDSRAIPVIRATI